MFGIMQDDHGVVLERVPVQISLGRLQEFEAVKDERLVRTGGLCADVPGSQGRNPRKDADPEQPIHRFLLSVR